MKITVKSLTDEAIERRDYRNCLTIEINGKKEFSVYDGEPEDANLSRYFSDCWNIPKLLEMAHAAGKNGEEFSIQEITQDEV